MSLVSDNRESKIMLDSLLERSGSFLLVGHNRQKIEQDVKVLAKKIACEESASAAACGACSNCQLIELGQHPDICWINPAGGSQKIKIEDIRTLKEKINLKPYQIKRKIFIITEAQRMGPEAANALLKTLEEPPLNASLILIASNAAELLPTVVSRCQLIRFTESDEQQNESFEQMNVFIRRFFEPEDDAEHLNFYEEVSALERAQVESLLNELAFVMRDILMCRLGRPSVRPMSMQAEDDIAFWADMFSFGDIEHMIEYVLYAAKCVKQNANIKLVMDILIKRFEENKI